MMPTGCSWRSAIRKTSSKKISTEPPESPDPQNVVPMAESALDFEAARRRMSTWMTKRLSAFAVGLILEYSLSLTGSTHTTVDPRVAIDLGHGALRFAQCRRWDG